MYVSYPKFHVGKTRKAPFSASRIWPPVAEGEFILRVGCKKERNRVLIPENAFTLALEYKRRFSAGEGSSGRAR
jgi:hypothetical protein